MLWKGLIWKNSQEQTCTKEHTNSIDPLFSFFTMNLAKTHTLRCFVTQTTACTIFMPLPFAQNAALDFHHHFPENWKKKPFCHTLIICLGRFPTSPEFDYSFCKSEAFVSWMNLRSRFQLCLSPFLSRRIQGQSLHCFIWIAQCHWSQKIGWPWFLLTWREQQYELWLKSLWGIHHAPHAGDGSHISVKIYR